MSISVSLCIIRIVECLDEITFNLESDSSGACSESLMATQSATSSRARRGRRQPRELRIETYSRNDDEGETPGPPALLPEADGKRRQFSECESTASGASGGVGTCPLGPIPFISGNPYVETIKGLLHLFKQDELTSLEEASTRSQTVCILAIPATMTCSDLLMFTAACHNDIKALRIIRDRVPNQYMALVTFRDPDSALEFYTTFNGAPYSSLDPECCCHLVFVSKIETLSADRPGDALGPPPSGHTELPLCPVCLERMDESVDGILTILCNHSFHGSCLAKWADISCPVCRYVQTPEVVADNRCLECHSADSLWICLICGHVGCGRYVHGHAYEHYLATQHCYSMQLGNNRVWDYVGDNFVHRLLQNKVDGKLVQGDPQESKETGRDEKLDSVQLEFTYLLTSQLESQRLYFDEKFSRLEKQMYDEGNELQKNFQQLSDENKELKEKLTQIAKEKSVVEKKMQQLTTRLTTAQAELHDERQMSQALRLNQTSWQNQVTSCEAQKEKLIEEKDKEIAELRDSMRDILFTLEAGREIEKSANREEIIQGQIVVGAPAQPSTSTSRNKKGGPRKGRR